MNNLTTPTTTTALNKKEWQNPKLRFSTQMQLLMDAGLSYEQAANEYHCQWDRLNPEVRKKLEKLKI